MRESQTLSLGVHRGVDAEDGTRAQRSCPSATSISNLPRLRISARRIQHPAHSPSAGRCVPYSQMPLESSNTGERERAALAGHLQHPDTRDKALAGRLATGLNHRLLDGLSRDEVLLLRAWLLQAAVRDNCEHWWRAQTDAWTRHTREASLERAFRLGGLDPFAERTDPAQRRGRVLADVLRYRLIEWRSQWWFDPNGVPLEHHDPEEQDAGEDVDNKSLVDYLAQTVRPARIAELLLLSIEPLQLTPRDALWWCGWLAWDAPADRMQQGPCPDTELIGRFLKETCRRSKPSHAPFEDLYRAYCRWAQRQWLLVLDPPDFITLVQSAVHAYTPSPEYRFAGLQLRAPDDPPSQRPPTLPSKPRPGRLY